LLRVSSPSFRSISQSDQIPEYPIANRTSTS
jgi:hypothetical protein